MAAKKPKSKSKPQRGPLEQLRVTVRKLRAELVQEARQRRLHMRLAEESKKARAKVAQQVEALKARGESIAKQLRGVIAQAEQKEKKVRAEAIAKVTELRKELALKTTELKRKSAELSKLALESAERARAIITEPAPPQTPAETPASQSGEAAASGMPKPPAS